MFTNQMSLAVTRVLTVMAGVISLAGAANADEHGHGQGRDASHGRASEAHAGQDQHASRPAMTWHGGDNGSHTGRDQHVSRPAMTWHGGDDRSHTESNRRGGLVWRHQPEHSHAAPVFSGHMHHEVVHGGMHYYVYGGTWYRHDHGRYLVVAPPLGIVIPILPPYATVVWFSGMPYYYANNVYYARCAQGYAVVQTVPVVTESAPAPSFPESISSENGVDELGPVSAAPPVTIARSQASQLFIYPRQGQSAAQQDRDRAECDEWAAGQTGVADLSDPNTMRAMSACLDGRGYTAK